jgi:cell surface protein SprA
MKNIYQIQGAYQIKQQDLRFNNILYTDPSPLNYISAVDGSPFPANPTDNKVQETPLLQVFNLDKLNYNNDRQTGGDGFMILSRHNNRFANGRIIFTTKEPFGELLFSKLSNTGSAENYNDAVLITPIKRNMF